MRVLRRDAAFMHAVREQELAVRDKERIAGQKRALTLLEQQEADMKSGGQVRGRDAERTSQVQGMGSQAPAVALGAAGPSDKAFSRRVECGRRRTRASDTLEDGRMLGLPD